MKLIDDADSIIGATDRLAQEFTKNNNNNKMVLISGGGVSGSMTAWTLLDRGYRVSVAAKEWYGEDANKDGSMCSQTAGALWEYPPSGRRFSENRAPAVAFPEPAQARLWAMHSFLFYEHLAKKSQLEEFGARMIALYQFSHHSHKDNRQRADSQTQENAREHHRKLQAIARLDTGYGDFRGKFKAGYRSLPLEDWNTFEFREWEDALSATNYLGSARLKWGYRHEAPAIDTHTAMEFLMKTVRFKEAISATREIKGDSSSTGRKTHA
ncbi:Putative protein of unknown function [Podospora comata]|uniref:FAD dependent oxidoreductase domain-containing protein n=1 Tax=Podospora comata TaxID=48703 RepID=A0ABY6S1L5_PODCO|nr:Putative protein of unknown function [Podospora comata]